MGNKNRRVPRGVLALANTRRNTRRQPPSPTVASMAACRAVLNTYELLEAILVELPPFEVAPMADVCRAWRDVVHRSTVLRSPMPVAPVSPGDLRRGLDEIVVYPAGTKLMLHPALQIDAELYTQYPSQLKLGPEPYREHWDKYWKRVDARALQRRTPLHQFATLPPVMSMSLRTTSVDGNEVAASLYVSEGIRLGDMENLARRMLQADGVYASASVTISLAAKDVSACTT